LRIGLGVMFPASNIGIAAMALTQGNKTLGELGLTTVGDVASVGAMGLTAWAGLCCLMYAQGANPGGTLGSLIGAVTP